MCPLNLVWQTKRLGAIKDISDVTSPPVWITYLLRYQDSNRADEPFGPEVLFLTYMQGQIATFSQICAA